MHLLKLIAAGNIGKQPSWEEVQQALKQYISIFINKKEKKIFLTKVRDIIADWDISNDFPIPDDYYKKHATIGLIDRIIYFL